MYPYTLAASSSLDWVPGHTSPPPPPGCKALRDGGSDDDTVAEARNAGATVLSSPRGRANQLNAGARAAQGDILLFLHADSTLPPSYDAQLHRLFTAQPSATGRAPPEWGAFKFKLGGEGRFNPGHRFVELSVNLRTFFFRMPYGDQGLIVRTSVFHREGGFPAMPFMVGRCRMTVSKPVLNAPMVSALEATI